MIGLGQFGTNNMKKDSYSSFFNKKRILITGYTGFKGSWLTKILSMWGAKISGIALAPTTRPNLFDTLNLKDNINGYLIDVRDGEGVMKIVAQEKPEIIIHLAAQAIVKDSYDDPLKTYSTNTLGMVNVLEAIRKVETIRSVVLITTDKVYENKEWIYPYREIDALGGYDPYSASKASADIIAQSYIQSFFNPTEYKYCHNTLIAIARAGNVIGGGDWSNHRLVPDVVRAILDQNLPVVLRNPCAIRPWEHVLEPLSGYLLLAKKMYQGDISASGAWNFGPDDDAFSTVEDLLNHAISILKKGKYIIKTEDGKHEAKLLKLDTSKSKCLLGWKPTLTFKENLEFTFEWYKKYYGSHKSIQTFTEAQIINFFSK